MSIDTLSTRTWQKRAERRRHYFNPNRGKREPSQRPEHLVELRTAYVPDPPTAQEQAWRDLGCGLSSYSEHE